VAEIWNPSRANLAASGTKVFPVIQAVILPGIG
jgi:hypothetical protein